MRRITNFLVLLAVMVSFNGRGQNLEELTIERLNQTSFTVPEECTPEDLIIVVNSSIPDLRFESNMLPDDQFLVQHFREINQYIICHAREKFKLTVSGSNIKSEDIEIFDLEKPHIYNITANTVKGTVNIITNPRNSTILFPGLNNLAVSSNAPFTNVSGKYRITIVKPDYESLDTSIVIPRNGEQTYRFDLVPKFARIQLNLKTDDNAPFVKTPVLWVDSNRIELEALVKPGVNQRSFFDAVEFYKFYEGQIIPVPEGNHRISIQLEGYSPFETTIQTRIGKLNNLSVSLEPIFGFITFIDRQNAEGTSIFLNDVNVGKVPMMKVKARVGNNRVRLEKPGFVSAEKEYLLSIEEKQNVDFEVVMLIARKISLITEPSFAEVFIDGERVNFTPLTIVLNEGEHSFLIKKTGFATEKFSKQIHLRSRDEETVRFQLKPVAPFDVQSERKGLSIYMEGLKELQSIEVENTITTPAKISVPYGRYRLSLKEGKNTLYRSTITHSPEIATYGKFPVYSKSAFHTLTGNFYMVPGETPGKHLMNFDAAFGRIHIFPGSGLSTSIVGAEYKEFTHETRIDSLDITRVDTLRTIAPYLFFMNWDWRLGGSILRQLDVCLLGQARYTPGLKVIRQNISGYEDVTMQKFFVGAELSSRISGLNLSLRVGQQFYDGTINVWSEGAGKYLKDNGIKVKNKKNDWVISAGLTLSGAVHRSNHLLRLWNQPFLNPEKRRVKDGDSPAPLFRGLFKKE